MRTIDIIAAKRDGQELSADDISHIVSGYVSGDVADYQMAAFLMAAFIRGLSFNETAALTDSMVRSGSVVDLSSVDGIKVDKHSTGGVGDKTTLVVVPILAACGLKVPKMSGRGLGFTGGTLDKLESIPGFNTALSVEQIVRQLNEIGAVIAGQTPDIVPADKKIYALRDVTATVDSIPLIAASIMSKKIACSSDVIFLDVKCGSGAFMGDIERARTLAETMISIGSSLGRKVGAAITNMDQPLGNAVGNSLEVIEAIDTLKCAGPGDFEELCVRLCGLILYISGHAESVDIGTIQAKSVLEFGAALNKFTQIIDAQGGDSRVISDTSLFKKAEHNYIVRSARQGYVNSINCRDIGRAASILGAGREKKEDDIDHAAGLIVKAKLGDYVNIGDEIAVLYTNNQDAIEEASKLVSSAYKIGTSSKTPPLIYELIFS